MSRTVKKAWKAFEKGETEQASELFAAATSNGSTNSHSLTQYGLFQLRLDQFESACENFRKSRELEPGNAAPVFFMALSQELANQSEASSQTLSELRQLSPHHQGISSLELLKAVRSGNPLGLLQSFGFGPEPAQGDRPSGLQRLAASLGMGNPEWLPSDLSSSSYLLGPLLLEVEKRLHPLEIPRLEHRAPLFDKELDSIKPEKRSLQEELAQVRNSLKAGPILKKGKSAFERSYGINDKEKQYHLLNEAARNLRLARKIDPFAFRVSYHLGETYIFLARQDGGAPYSRFRLIQAENCFLASAEKEGINPYLLFYIAYIQHLLGRPVLAIKYYQEATKRFEKLPEAHYGEGQCELLLGNDRRAKELLLKAVNSDLALARERLDLYANLLAERGIEHFDKPVPTMPPPPQPEALEKDEDLTADDPNQPNEKDPGV